MNIERQQGFTLIELILISVIVGILATVVALAYNGVQAKNRNSQRQADINALQGKLETYYVEKSKYPSLAELNNAKWRQANLKEAEEDMLRDPQWSNAVPACTDVNGQATLSASPAIKCYAYQATAADGAACGATTICAQYGLTATFEGGEKYVKTSLN